MFGSQLHREGGNRCPLSCAHWLGAQLEEHGINPVSRDKVGLVHSESFYNFQRDVRGGWSVINAARPTHRASNHQHLIVGRQCHRHLRGGLAPRDEHITDQEALTGLTNLVLANHTTRLRCSPVCRSRLTNRATIMYACSDQSGSALAKAGRRGSGED
jgi:hypothetical protein